MELEVVRAMAAGAADPTIGINAQIDALTLDRFGDPRPSHVAFYNYVDHAWVARKSLNIEEARNSKATLPAVAIYLEASPTLDPEVRTIYRDGEFPIALSYITDEPDPVKAMREGLYVNRATLRFLTQFNSNAYKDTLRLRNGVGLTVSTALSQYTPFTPFGEALLAAQTIVTYRVREHQP